VVDGIDYVVDENVCEKTRESMGGGGTVMLFVTKERGPVCASPPLHVCIYIILLHIYSCCYVFALII